MVSTRIPDLVQSAIGGATSVLPGELIRVLAQACARVPGPLAMKLLYLLGRAAMGLAATVA